MELYIGGYKQGKLRYVMTKYPNKESAIVNDLHIWIKKLIKDGEDAESVVMEYIDKHPDCILICDEVGNGIVPLDPFERNYREQVGRILIKVAERANRVERVTCGLGQRIK